MRRSLAIALLLLTTSACANASPTPSRPADHPSGSNDLLLRVHHEGGFVPAEYRFTSLPTFSLYGDGTVITPGAQTEIYPGAALPPIVARRISEEGVRAILDAALSAGLDRDGDHSDMGNMGVADASTTVFTFQVDGVTHRVTAYALEFENDGEDPRRAALRSFERKLGALDEWLPQGSLGDGFAFDATSARILVGPYRPDEDLPQEANDWPLATSLRGMGEPIEVADGTRCTVLSGTDWSAVRALAQGSNQLTPWISDEETYALTFRPLLPDEAGC